MIWIFNLERASASVCDNYNDVFHYICSIEKQYFEKLSRKSKKDMHYLEFLCESDKKQWCLEFCRSHNYDIIETPTQAVNTPHSTMPSQSAWQFEERFKHAS